MLVDYARTDGHRLRRYEPVAPATREISALARVRTGAFCSTAHHRMAARVATGVAVAALGVISVVLENML